METGARTKNFQHHLEFGDAWHSNIKVRTVNVVSVIGRIVVVISGGPRFLVKNKLLQRLKNAKCRRTQDSVDKFFQYQHQLSLI